MTSVLTVRAGTMVRCSSKNDVPKRVKSDIKKVTTAFEKIQRESDIRNKEMKESFSKMIKELDKVAREDTGKLSKLFEAEPEVEIVEDTYSEIDDILVFKDGD